MKKHLCKYTHIFILGMEHTPHNWLPSSWWIWSLICMGSYHKSHLCLWRLCFNSLYSRRHNKFNLFLGSNHETLEKTNLKLIISIFTLRYALLFKIYFEIQISIFFYLFTLSCRLIWSHDCIWRQYS